MATAIGIVGRKAGMTRVFTDEGVSVPVTVIEADLNVFAPELRQKNTSLD